jgi:hypothetical protein
VFAYVRGGGFRVRESTDGIGALPVLLLPECSEKPRPSFYFLLRLRAFQQMELYTWTVFCQLIILARHAC